MVETRAGEPAVEQGLVRRAFIWNAANFGINQVLGAVVFFIVANQLEDARIFGVFAMALVVLDFWSAQGRYAAVDAMVQGQAFDRRTLSTIFWALTGMSVFLLLLLLAAGNGIAAVLGDPAVAPILWALSVTLLFTPISAVGDAIAVKDFRFRRLALRNMVGIISGAIAGLVVVFSPWAEWAFVAQRVAWGLSSAVLIWVTSGFMPRFEFDQLAAHKAVRAFFPLWSSHAMAIAGPRLVEGLIGLRLGMDSLGAMRMAGRLVEVLQGPISNPIMALFVPMMTRMDEDPAGRVQFYLRLSALSAMISVPVFIGLALVAQEIVRVLLPPEYEALGAAEALIVLCCINAFSAITMLRGALLVGLRKNRTVNILIFFELAMVLPLLWFATQNGLTYAMTAMLILVVAVFVPVSGYVMARSVGARLIDVFLAIGPAFLAAAAMSVTVLALKTGLAGVGDMVRLLVVIPLGAAAYVGWIALVHRGWGLQNVNVLLRR